MRPCVCISAQECPCNRGGFHVSMLHLRLEALCLHLCTLVSMLHLRLEALCLHLCTSVSMLHLWNVCFPKLPLQHLAPVCVCCSSLSPHLMASSSVQLPSSSVTFTAPHPRAQECEEVPRDALLTLEHYGAQCQLRHKISGEVAQLPPGACPHFQMGGHLCKQRARPPGQRRY